MALTESHMLPLDTQVSDFRLLNTLTDRHESLSSHVGKNGTLIVVMCNHCPYVVYLLDHFVKFAKSIVKSGINTVAISSNDAHKYPADGPAEMKQMGLEKGFEFPYFYDEEQTIARKLDAACTPDFFLLNAQNKLVYRGRYDQARPGNDHPISGEDLNRAIEDMLADRTTTKQYPSMGCSIKWLPENES